MKILIIRFSSIGDIVLTSPVVRCIKHQLGDVEIHFLTKSKHYDLVKSNPYIDRIHLFDSSLQEIIPSLQEEKFDYVIDLHHNIRSQIVKSNLKSKALSLNKINLRKWLLINLRINVMPNIHIVDRMFHALAPLGIKNDYKGLDYFIPADDETPVDNLPKDYRNGYVAVVLAGSFFTKRLPAEKHLEYMSQCNVPYVMIGGKDEVKIAEEIEKNTGLKVLNYCDKLNIGESASIVRNARLVITNDTGLMHIASAFNKKILSIWGSTTPDLGMYPYFPDSYSKMLKVNGLSCQPCSKIGKHECPKNHFKCMLEINSNDVAEWIEDNFDV